MTHWKSMHESEHLTAVEFNGREPTWTIDRVEAKKLPVKAKPGEAEQGQAKERSKPIVHFKEVDRPWVLNKVNGACVEAMFGAHVEGWAGKRVTLHAVEVQVGPKKELGIRVVGSPDLQRPVKVTISHPRKRDVEMTMAVTGQQRAQRPATNQQPARTPGEEG